MNSTQDRRKFKKGVLTVRLQKWSEFTDLIQKDHANSPAFIYRGQANEKWKVESTLDRLEHRFPQKPSHCGNNPLSFNRCPATRQEHLTAFQRAALGKRGVNPPQLSEDEWWMLAQHHGLATPMLDWTYSPFVALFFAFEEATCADNSGAWVEPKKRAVYTLSSHLVAKDASEGVMVPKVFAPRAETSSRLVNQAGLFVRMPEGSDLESCVREQFHEETESIDCPAQATLQTLIQKAELTDRPCPPQTILHKIIIPNEGRTDCLKLLNKMNINRMSLFPDLDGAADYVKSLWELDFDTLLGHRFESPLPESDPHR